MARILILAAALAAGPALAQASGDPLLGPSAPGRWTYAQVAGGTEARFFDQAGTMQLAVRCTRATRRIAFVRPAMAAAPSLGLWASGAARSLPASFDPAAAQLRAEIGVFDRLLDALAFSRGRFAVGVPGAPPIIVPNWPEATRAIEDCRN